MKAAILIAAAALVLTGACTPPTGSSPALSQSDDQPAATPVGIAARLNAERRAHGLAGLTRSATLEAAARGHARDMAARGYFSHTGADGATLGDRARAQGYAYCGIAENIAKGQPNEAAVMQVWMRSQGHRRNILDPQMTQFGMARSRDYWVLALGRPGC